MCGRYSLTFIFEELAQVFNAIIEGIGEMPPRYNVAPTQTMPVVTKEQAQNRLRLMRWGLIPSWSRDQSIGSRLINARRETLAEKPAFKHALAQRRCLIPADGYYEWQAQPGQRGKQPYRIIVPGRPVFAFAGLWESWGYEQDKLHTFTIITAAAGIQVRAIHDRMPLILSSGQEEEWLRGPKPGQSLNSFLDNFEPENNLHAYPVAPVVNSVRHDLLDCITPLVL